MALYVYTSQYLAGLDLPHLTTHLSFSSFFPTCTAHSGTINNATHRQTATPVSLRDDQVHSSSPEALVPGPITRNAGNFGRSGSKCHGILTSWLVLIRRWAGIPDFGIWVGSHYREAWGNGPNLKLI